MNLFNEGGNFMFAKILLLNVNPYDFKDENTGRNVKGVSMNICQLDSANSYGCQPAKLTCDISLLPIFQSVHLPAFCTMEFEYDFNRKKAIPKNFKNFSSIENALKGA